MTARWCADCEKDGHRSYGAAMAAAWSYSAKRDTPLRVYSSPCGYFHLSSKISERDFEMAVA